MKRVLLILVIVLVFDCGWARKLEDADHFLLDENRANRFLEVHKRGGELNMCPFAWEFHNEAGISSFPYKLNPLSLTQFAVKEECCVEGCDTEEMDEIIFKLFYSDHAYSEYVRERYVANCCR